MSKSNEHTMSQTTGTDLPATIEPDVNASRMASDRHRDHSKGINAYISEFIQNALDAFYYNTSEGNIVIESLNVVFRYDPEEKTLEIWDNAGGMTKEEVKDHYISLGNPGSEKIGRDTGGNQGVGFWAMACWSQSAVVHSLDQDGNEWCARVKQQEMEAARSEVKRVEDTEYESRDELSTAGTYVRFENVEDQTATDLSDGDGVKEAIGTKFAFPLSRHNLSVEYQIIGDGTYTPETYDIESCIEEGAIVENVDLETFNEQGERQLRSLYLIDNRRLDNDEAPWTGVAMLKGSEYSDEPYLSVDEYAPQQHPITREGQMWGWVDAGELCPDLEAHGHTKFQTNCDIHGQSGLRDAIFEASEEHFNNQTAEDQEEVSEFGTEKINEYMEKFNGVGSGDGSGTTTEGETTPDDPTLRVNASKHELDVGDEVPLSISVRSPKSCEVDNVYISCVVKKTSNADGDDPPQEVVEQSRAEMSVEEGQINTEVDDFDRIATGKYLTEKHGEGVYTFRAELYQHPNPHFEEDEMKSINFDLETSLKTKPVLDTSQTTFRVGDVDTGPDSPSNSQSEPDGMIESVIFREEGEASWRAKQELSTSGDSYHIIINVDHPEYEAFRKLYKGHSLDDIKSDIAAKWGFLRIHFNQATTELEELLEEHNIDNPQVRSGMGDILKERVENYDAFREEFISDSPLTEDMDVA